MERKLCNCSGQATLPSIPYVWVEKRFKIFPDMETSSWFKKHLGERRIQDSMEDIQRFKTGWEETTGHQALHLVLEMLMVLDPPTCQRDLPYKKSQLDLRPFGVVVPTVGRKVMPWPRCCTEKSSKGVTDAVHQGMSRRGSNTSKLEESEGEFQFEMDYSQLG